MGGLECPLSDRGSTRIFGKDESRDRNPERAQGVENMGKFTFTVDCDCNLKSIAKKTNRETKAEVIRDALTLYEFLLGEYSKEGRKIFIGKELKEAHELKISCFPQHKNKE